MARTIDTPAKRPRISVDVSPELHSRLRLAAARRDLTVRQYLLETIEARLRKDLDERSGECATVLTAAEAPALAELWDNPYDAIYDRL
jgi:hypothetical protein